MKRLIAALILTCLWVGYLTAQVSAETIRLKNGNVMTGTITHSNEREVTMTIPDMGAMTLSRSEIASIEPSADAEPQAVKPSSPAPTTAPNPSTTSDASLALFKSATRSVQVFYPKDWHVMESPNQHPYLVTIEPTPPDPNLHVMAPLTIELFKFYHISLTMEFGRDTTEQIIDRYLEGATKVGQGKVLEQQPLRVQGVQGRLATLQATDPRSTTPLKIFVLVAVKDDVLAALFCQAPEAQFATYAPVFQAVVQRVRPFSNDPSTSDNTQLDRESARLANEALKLLQAKNGKEAIDRFELMLRINPGDAFGHMNYGSLLVELSRNTSGENRSGALQRAEQELQIARQLFEKGRETQKSRALAQICFLLGQIAEYGRGDHERAKSLYEQALTYDPAHPFAGDALKRVSAP